MLKYFLCRKIACLAIKIVYYIYKNFFLLTFLMLYILFCKKYHHEINKQFESLSLNLQINSYFTGKIKENFISLIYKKSKF